MKTLIFVLLVMVLASCSTTNTLKATYGNKRCSTHAGYPSASGKVNRYAKQRNTNKSTFILTKKVDTKKTNYAKL